MKRNAISLAEFPRPAVDPQTLPVFALDPVVQLYRVTNYSRKRRNRIFGRSLSVPDFRRQESRGLLGRSSSFEPAWANKVGEKGDLFYVEPPEGEDILFTSQQPLHVNGNNNTGFNSHELTSAQTNGSAKQKEKTSINKIKGFIGRKKKEESNGHANVEHNNTTTPRTVTFQDSVAGQGLWRHVYINVEPGKHNYGRRATLCETVFGIIPGSFHSQPMRNGVENGGSVIRDTRIMVQGLVPEGEAIKCGHVKIGDWLMKVNDLDVDFDTIDTVISTIQGPAQVKLTLQKLASDSPSRPVLARKANDATDHLVRLVSGERLDAFIPQLKDVPHMAMYLTLESSSDSMREKEDIVYQFPRQDNKLVQVRGLFITLCHMLVDVTNNSAKNSTLLVEGQLVHVGYSKQGREVLIIGVPANRVVAEQLDHLVDDTVRLMKILYGSLRGAFTPRENKEKLDHYFSLLFRRVLLSDELRRHGMKCVDAGQEGFLDTLPGVRWLDLPDDPKVNVSNSLSELEAADFAEMSDSYYDTRRSYTILGSCLFYKGYLIANHLHKEDFLDIVLYTKYYCLLALSSEHQVGQVVVWKEVFPTRRCHEQTDPLIPGYTEPDARWFLLVVGLKHSLICVLLEAGGCAGWIEGHPTPDPFFVDQARATLLHLETLDLAGHCEARLCSPSLPALTNADQLVQGNKGASSQQNSKAGNKTGASPANRKSQGPESILKNKKPSPLLDRSRTESDADSTQSFDTSEGSTPVLSRTFDRKPSAGSEDSGGSAGSNQLFKNTGKKSRNMPGAYDMSGLRKDLLRQDSVKMTAGLDNTLFHYLHLDSLEGVYVCPTGTEVDSLKGSDLHVQLVQNFHACCLIIRKVFEKAVQTKERESRGTRSRLGEDTSLIDVKEHGVLFRCSPESRTDKKKEAPLLTYWVVGRLFFDPYPREVYVCFQDSAQQNLVELAFKLSFGMYV